MSLTSPSDADVERLRRFRLHYPRPRKGQQTTYYGEVWEFDGVDWYNRTARRLAEQAFEMPSEKVLALSDAVGRNAVAQDAAMPDRHSILKEFPELTVTELGDGKWEANGPLAPERRKRLDEMFAEQRRLETEKAEMVSADNRTVALEDHLGNKAHVPEQHAEMVAKKKGLREAGRIARKGKA